MKLYKEAGLPDGVINFVPGDAEMVSDTVFSHKEFAGIHYTGSTAVFQHIWKQIGTNIHKYRQFPRIVGESGGKDFIFAHPTANVDRLATAMIRGAFEFAGQKCSAASRAYIPESIWPALQKKLLHDMAEVKMGNPEKAGTLVNAVIHKRSFDKAKEYIEYARNSPEAKIIWGGT
jgi:1-pyrroline-5-carboxylate dehydrogenase